MPTGIVIEQKLRTAFAPTYLDVIDESHQHNVPSGAESHFKIVIVSNEFADQSLIARHRSINQLLAEELNGGVHALSLKTMTPQEWQKKGGVVAASPPCLGGDGKRSAPDSNA